jgi:tetratricopeptide (TPR) repeat protein
MFDHFFALYCPDCGGKIQDDEEYCPLCGTNLDVSMDPGDEDTFLVELDHLKSAQQLYDKGSNLEEALSNCELALEKLPMLADAHNLRGLILDDMGRIDEAIKAYRKALEINPGHEGARANLTDAEKEIAEIAVQRPINKNIKPKFRICPDCGGKIQTAEEYCPRCGTNLDVSMDTSDGSASLVELDYLQSAQQLYNNGFNLEEALLDCELALVKCPELADAHNLRGLILDDMGRTDEAIKAYRKALEINPGHVDARANLTDAEKEIAEIAVQQSNNKKP